MVKERQLYLQRLKVNGLADTILVGGRRLAAVDHPSTAFYSTKNHSARRGKNYVLIVREVWPVVVMNLILGYILDQIL